MANLVWPFGSELSILDGVGVSKLLKLKKWLSLNEAATVISNAFNERVGSSDVLQLALDGYLMLSVNLVNGVYARPCRPVAYKDVEWQEVPSLDGSSMVKIPAKERLLLLGGGLLLVEREIRKLVGVWDLPLIGGERADVEKMFHRLNFGPDRDAVAVDGVLVKGSEGQIFEIQDRSSGGSGKDPLASLVDPVNFHPAGALPDDCEFVVRWGAIEAFIAQASDQESMTEKPLQSRERDTLLNIIAVMLEFLQNPRPGRNSETAVIAEMIENYGDKPGISKRTLEDKFALAKKSLTRS